MKKKTKILLLIFLVVAFAQLWFPLSMISKHKTILKKGDVVKMKLAPRDPVHPFQGKYLQLTFEQNNFTNKDKEWKRNDIIYLHYSLAANGYLKVDSLSAEVDNYNNIMKVKVLYYSKYNNSLVIKYPFDKYFIDESKALPAEQKIAELIRKKQASVYAEISILNSIPVLKEVYVDDVPILDFLSKK